jgi:hypothetical protein
MNKRLMWGGALVALTVWSGGVHAQAASAPEAEQAAVPVASEASKSGVIDKGIDIAMASAIPYLDEGNIADNIVNECKGLGLALSSSVSRRSKAQGFNVNRDEHFDATKSKQALDIKIVSAVSGGNAFIGHHKSVSIRAELYRDGKLVSKVSKTRDSSGGFGAGFKGSCSVLERSAETLGADVAKWLATQGG